MCTGTVLFYTVDVQLVLDVEILQGCCMSFPPHAFSFPSCPLNFSLASYMYSVPCNPKSFSWLRSPPSRELVAIDFERILHITVLYFTRSMIVASAAFCLKFANRTPTCTQFCLICKKNSASQQHISYCNSDTDTMYLQCASNALLTFP